MSSKPERLSPNVCPPRPRCGPTVAAITVEQVDGHRSAIWDGDPEPDVWWGKSGIDALIWADPRPYEEPLSDAPAEVSAGDPR